MKADSTPLCLFCLSETPYEGEDGHIRSIPLMSGCYLVAEPLLQADIENGVAVLSDENNSGTDRIDQIAALAERYHHINQAVMAQGACLPTRFGLIVRSEEEAGVGVRGLLPHVAQLFDRVRGREEWCVKVTISEEDFENLRQNRETRTNRDAKPGRAYLLLRKRAQVEELSHRAHLLDIVEACHRACANESVMALRLDRMAAPEGEIPLLSGAYLVESSRVGHFRWVVRQLGPQYPLCRIQPTGPWPPYDFVSGGEALAIGQVP